MFDARLLNGIGVLIAVVECGSFAGAAQGLGLTPSGVSRAIARLETRLGVRLFHRTPRRVELTEDGRQFHAEVAPLLSAIGDAAELVQGSATAVSGQLRVNADPWFARVVLAPRLPALFEAFPQLSIDLQVSNHSEGMLSGGFDLAIRFGSPRDSALVARKLLETRVITCASPTYLGRNGTPRHPRDVSRHDLLLFRNPETGRPFGWEFQRDGEVIPVSASGRFVTDDPSAAIEACASGLGLFQSLELGLRPWLESGKLVAVLPQWSNERFPLYAYYPSRRMAPRKVRAFLDWLFAPVQVEATA
jgi:DNA-binding transcriptional LysR family regulator